MKFKFLLSVWLGVLCFGTVLKSQNEFTDVPDISQTHLIKNASVIVKPGDAPLRTSVLVSDGIIQAVGNDLQIPADAIHINGDSLFVYAGFISGLSHAGIPKPKNESNSRSGEQRNRVKDPGNPPNDVAGITPEREVRDYLKPDDKSIEQFRNAGFTSSLVVPRGNMLPGQGTVILHGGKTIDNLIYSEQSTLFAQLSSARSVYPNTIIGVMAKWRELFTQAKYAAIHIDTYKENPVGTKRPVYDAPVISLIPAQKGEIPVIVKAPKVLDIHRTMALQNDLEFDLMLAEVRQGWHTIDLIQTKEIPIFLSLKIPKESKKEKKDLEATEEKQDQKKKKKKKGRKKAVESKKPEKEDDAEMKMLKEKKKKSIAEYQKQASVFEKSGIQFGFSTLDVKPAEIHENLRLMIKAGLSERAALAALTTNPAKILGLSDVMGTIEQGKIANLVVTDKPYFDEKSKIKIVFVDGKKYTQKKNDQKAKPSRSRNSSEQSGG